MILPALHPLRALRLAMGLTQSQFVACSRGASSRALLWAVESGRLTGQARPAVHARRIEALCPPQLDAKTVCAAVQFYELNYENDLGDFLAFCQGDAATLAPEVANG